MWHPSYGELATQQLEQWRADAARERAATASRSLVQAPRAGLRIRLGRTLVRAGERLAGAAARPAMR